MALSARIETLALGTFPTMSKAPDASDRAQILYVRRYFELRAAGWADDRADEQAWLEMLNAIDPNVVFGSPGRAAP